MTQTTRRASVGVGAVAMAASLAIGIVAGVSGCTGPAPLRGGPSYLDPTIDRDAAPAVAAVVDEVEESFTLPLDAYLFTPEQMEYSYAAYDDGIADCVAAAGFDPGPPQRIENDPDYLVDNGRLFGPVVLGSWNVDHAERVGDDSLRSDEALAADGARASWVAQQGSEYTTVWQGCAGQAPAPVFYGPEAEFGNPDTPGLDTVLAGYRGSEEAVTASDEYRAALKEFHTCIRESGFEPGDEFTVEWNSADPVPGSVAEATCHERVGSVQRILDVAARYQQAYIDRYADELSESMAEKDRVAAAQRASANTHRAAGPVAASGE